MKKTAETVSTVAEAEAAATTRKPLAYRAKSRRRVMNLPPESLTPHPMLARVGMLPDLIDGEWEQGLKQGKNRQAHKDNAEAMTLEMAALETGIRESGIRENLKVVKNPAGGWWIADGRHRWHIAQKLELKTVPCEVIEESEVLAAIMAGVQHRSMSKGARAYLAVLMKPEVATEAKRGGDRKSNRTECGLITAETLANEAGVSVRLIEDAVALFKVFAKRQDVRKRFESAIWVGAGLAKLRAGIEGFLKTGKEPEEEKETEEQAKARIAAQRVGTALDVWTHFTASVKYWETLPPDGRSEVTRAAKKALLTSPQELRKELLEALQSAEN